MSSLNPVNNTANSYFASKTDSPNKRQIQVQTHQVEQARDQFVKRIQGKIDGASTTDRPSYSVKNRFTQFQAKIDGLSPQPTTTQAPTAQAPAAQTPTTQPVPTETPVATPETFREAETRTNFTGAELAAPVTTPEPEVEGSEDRLFNFTDLESARDLIGARTDDQGFIGDYDLDGDGEISFSDIVSMLFRYDSGEASE